MTSESGMWRKVHAGTAGGRQFAHTHEEVTKRMIIIVSPIKKRRIKEIKNDN
jgi:hypothetical protein